MTLEPSKSKAYYFKNWTLLLESHNAGCPCSYCKEDRVGIVLPQCKAGNSWRSIRWKWRGRLHVIRWTLP